MGKRFYGVKTQEGKELIYTNWPECEQFVKHKSNIIFKGFNSYDDLQEWFKNQKIANSQDNDPNYTRVYVDGSYNKTNRKAGWAFVVPHEGCRGVSYYESGEICSFARQIDGELWAAYKAAHWAYNCDKKIIVVHDYSGVGQFAVGNWSPKTITAQQYVNLMKHYMSKNFIKFEKIAGHSGNKWNDMADELAKKGCGL